MAARPPTVERGNIEAVLSRFECVRKNGDGWTARCRAHADHTPSLSISEADGKVLLHCHAGCTPEDVVSAAGLTMADLFVDSPQARIVATYDYRDESGRLLSQVARSEPKSFRQRRPDGNGGWIHDVKGVRRILYHLPEVLTAENVLVCEGEKDCDTAHGLGLTATCNPSGAGKWRDEYSEYLRGKHVAVIADADELGRKHAASVAESLRGKAASVKVLELPGAKDLSEWVARGGTREVLLNLIANTPECERLAPGNGALELAMHDDAARESASRWPKPLDIAARQGLAGEFVRIVEPHTESDPAALLIQFLVAFGCAAGRGPYFSVEATHHHANIAACCVGSTGHARKGTAWGHARKVIAAADPTFAQFRIKSGLSSGEGIIYNVRDAAGQDAGESDKRLLIFESEFAGTLRTMGRDGNNAGAVMRQAFDGTSLSTLTRNSPLLATDPHVAMIAHITQQELLRYLHATECAGGTGNRILWVATRRSKPLPEGGSLPDGALDGVIAGVRNALEAAKTPGEIRRDTEARAMWAEAYSALTSGRPGMIGHLLNRMEAQAARLSMIYALLDRSRTIRREHLEAALAVTDFCRASVECIWGDLYGDEVADRILGALRESPEGLTRTEISELFQRHKPQGAIAASLLSLERDNLVSKSYASTPGRSAERWRVTA